MLRNQANHQSVTARTDLAEGLPIILADRMQLQQVLSLQNKLARARGTLAEGIERSQSRASLFRPSGQGKRVSS